MMMKVLLLASLLALAMGQETISEHQFYHTAVGIQAAANIKAAEEALDFNGSRIIGGLPIALGTHPFMAGLIITLTSGHMSVCGSAILSNTRVLTAAHCYFDGMSLAQVFQVVFGTTLLFTGGSRVSTSSVVMHPAWSWSTMANDIAVLNTPYITFSNVVSSIQLPSGAMLGNDFVGTWAHTSGFGAINPGGNIVMGQPKQHVWLEVISNHACQPFYANIVSPSMMCTDSSRNQGPCNGDSGGPLVGFIDGQHVLIGISSFFHYLGCVGGPAGWSRITSYSFWIASHMV